MSNQFKFWRHSLDSVRIFTSQFFKDRVHFFVPSAQGTTNSVLTNDGSGNLSWYPTNRITTTPYQLPTGDSRVIINPANGVVYLPAGQPMGTIVIVGDTNVNPSNKTLDVASGSGKVILKVGGVLDSPRTISGGGSVSVMKTSGSIWVVVSTA